MKFRDPLGRQRATAAHTAAEEWQQVVDGLNAHFLEAVHRGRRMPMDEVK